MFIIAFSSCYRNVNLLSLKHDAEFYGIHPLGEYTVTLYTFIVSDWIRCKSLVGQSPLGMAQWDISNLRPHTLIFDVWGIGISIKLCTGHGLSHWASVY